MKWELFVKKYVLKKKQIAKRILENRWRISETVKKNNESEKKSENSVWGGGVIKLTKRP